MKKTLGLVLAIAMSGSASAEYINPDNMLLQLHTKDSVDPSLQIDLPSRLICDLWAAIYTKQGTSGDSKWSCTSKSFAKNLPVEMTLEFAHVPVKAHFETLERCESFQMPTGEIPVLKACAAKETP